MTEDDANRPALEAAADADRDGGAATRLVQNLMKIGLDGFGALDSAREIADRARADAADTEAAIAKVVRSHVIGGGVGGFATGLGGFLTMPIALPANVFEFYVQATRMVGAIAALRGYDVSEQRIRTAILLTLVGSQADDVLSRAGVSTGGGRLTALALDRLPPAALMIVNKAVGFRLLRGLGERLLPRLGRAVPLVGGLVGGGVDAYMMKRIADHARREFPPTD